MRHQVCLFWQVHICDTSLHAKKGEVLAHWWTLQADLRWGSLWDSLFHDGFHSLEWRLQKRQYYSSHSNMTSQLLPTWAGLLGCWKLSGHERSNAWQIKTLNCWISASGVDPSHQVSIWPTLEVLEAPYLCQIAVIIAVIIKKKQHQDILQSCKAAPELQSAGWSCGQTNDDISIQHIVICYSFQLVCCGTCHSCWDSSARLAI